MTEAKKYDSLNPRQRKALREEYVESQGQRCWYCKKLLTEEPNRRWKINWALFPPNFLKHPVHLHHSHVTGMTIGVVHAYCNAVLWQYEGE